MGGRGSSAGASGVKTPQQTYSDRLNSIASQGAGQGTENGDYNYTANESNWEKSGKSRTYYSVTETRVGSKHYKKHDFGYLDNNTGNYVSGNNDLDSTFGVSGSKLSDISAWK